MLEPAKTYNLYKPNGKKVQVNEQSLKYALSIGWTKAKPKK